MAMTTFRISSRAAAALGAVIPFAAACGLACALASPKTLLCVTAGLLLFTLPGLTLCLALFGRNSYRRPEWLIFGSVLGIALSGYTSIVGAYLLGWSPKTVILGIVFLTIGCALAARALWNHPLLPLPPRWHAWEYVVLGVMVLVLIAFVAVPLLNVGKLTTFGYAYTWLFGYDFLVRGEYVTAMTIAFPPNCMPLAGEPLNMYLVAYTLPAFVYSASHKSLALHAILQLTGIAISMLFFGCLFAVLRLFTPKKKALLPASLVCMFAYSYYWLVSIAKYISARPHQPSELQRLGNYLVNYGYVSHLFTPLVLVELPALLALSLLLLLLFVAQLLRYHLDSYRLAILLGLILGILFGIDATLSPGVMLWFGVLYCLELLRGTCHRFTHLARLGTAVFVCALVSLSFFVMGMYHLRNAQSISLVPYWWFIKSAPLYLLLEFGPLALLGVWGLALQWKRRPSGVPLALTILAAIAVLQVVFVRMSETPRVRMADRILPLVFIIGVAYLFDELYRRGSHRRALYVAWAIVLLGVPTFVTDVFFTSNINDVNETHYVRPADRKACDWIHHNLSQTSVIQGEPKYVGYVGGNNGRQELFISLIADFAERPQALGWPYIASELVPDGNRIVFQRMKELDAMLSAEKSDTIITIANKYEINFIYVGPYEQSLHPGLLNILRSAATDFKEVYSDDGVHIFAIGHLAGLEIAAVPRG